MLNAWIPVATAIVSASAVLLAGFMTNLHSRRLKLLELNATHDVDHAKRKREAGEEVYKALQRIGHIQSQQAENLIYILDRTMSSKEGRDSNEKLGNEASKIDVAGIRLKLEVYFPSAQKAWSDYFKLIEDFEKLSLMEVLRNVTEKGDNWIHPNHQKYRDLPTSMISTVNRICSMIVREFDS